jgi:MoxR-like ATPase
MFDIVINHLPEDEEMEVVGATTSLQDIKFEHAITGPDIVAFQRLVRRVPVSDSVMRYTVDLVRRSRPENPGAPAFIKEWVDYGASVRAAQYLILGGKTRALLQGRYHVSFEDIQALAQPVLRHRILTNFHAESERVTSDQITEQLLEAVPLPQSRM